MAMVLQSGGCQSGHKTGTACLNYSASTGAGEGCGSYVPVAVIVVTAGSRETVPW